MKIEKGKVIAFAVDKDLVNYLRLLNMQMKSYEILYATRKQTTVKEYEELDIESLKNKYANLKSEYNELYSFIMRNYLNESIVKELNEKFHYRYMINYDDCICTIIIMDNKEIDDNES